MSDVFQEVDEELRRQQLDTVFRTYAPWVAAAAIVFFASFAGFTFWQSYKESQAAAAGNQLIQGMETLGAGDQVAAAALFAGITNDAPSGYALLARMQEAAAKRQVGDVEGALALYDQIAAEDNNPEEFRDLARYYGGLTALGSESATYEDISARLLPVADGDGPWRFHAREALGYTAFREGDIEFAAEQYQRLTDDPLTPVGVAARATEMLNLTDATIDVEADAVTGEETVAQPEPATE